MLKKILLVLAALYVITGIGFCEPNVDSKVASGSPKAWALGTIALLSERNNDRHDTLSGKESIGEKEIIKAKQLLRDWWDIDDRNSLLKALVRLDESGDRRRFEKIKAFVSLYTEEQIEELLSNRYSQEDAQEINFVINDYEGLDTKSLFGWDYGRYIFLCRMGYLAGYISEKEAWSKIMPVAKFLQEAFESWEDLGKNYLLGREFCSPEQMEEDGRLFRMGYEKLLRDHRSPWNSCPWNTDLSFQN